MLGGRHDEACPRPPEEADEVISPWISPAASAAASGRASPAPASPDTASPDAASPDTSCSPDMEMGSPGLLTSAGLLPSASLPGRGGVQPSLFVRHATPPRGQGVRTASDGGTPHLPFAQTPPSASSLGASSLNGGALSLPQSPASSPPGAPLGGEGRRASLSAPGSAKRPAAARLDGILHELRTATNPKAAPRYLGRLARILNGDGGADGNGGADGGGDVGADGEGAPPMAAAGGGARRKATSALFDSDESDDEGGGASRAAREGRQREREWEAPQQLSSAVG